MVLLSFLGGFLEVAVFLVAVTGFLVALRFFNDSRKRLNKLFPGLLNPGKIIPFGIDRSSVLVPKRAVGSTAFPAYFFGFATKEEASGNTKETIQELRQQLQQQQKDMAAALRKLALADAKATTPSTKTKASPNEHLALIELQNRLEAKEAEIQRLRQQEAYAQKLQEQLIEVQDAFEEMQEKLEQMERQAWQTADVNLQLEQAMQQEQKLQAALTKKEEKLRELSLENSELQEASHELESKLSEAHRQHQQLLRKVQLLEGLNTDMLQMAEATRKLKSSMARAAELESLLQTITPGERK